MPNFRPGTAEDCFIERCIKKHLPSIVKCAGDRNVTIDGQSGCCVYWNMEEDKDADGFVRTPNKIIIMCWPCNSPFTVKADSEVIRKGLTYKVRNDPEDQHDGWFCATLKYCGAC